MAKELIFLVEDDTSAKELIEFNLCYQGYSVQSFDDGETMLLACKNTTPDLFIMDIMLPGIDGLEVCLRLKGNNGLKKVPIIFLTVKSDEVEKIVGFEIGADDYITKPFSLKELEARVKAILRRQKLFFENIEIKTFKNLKIDFERLLVEKDNILLQLSYKEFELLKLLILNKRRVITRDIIFEKVWGNQFLGDSRTVDVHIRSLRKKIEDDDSKPKFIETIRGLGYRFNDI